MPSVLGYLLLPGEGRGLAAGVQEGVTAWKERSGGRQEEQEEEGGRRIRGRVAEMYNPYNLD